MSAIRELEGDLSNCKQCDDKNCNDGVDPISQQLLQDIYKDPKQTIWQTPNGTCYGDGLKKWVEIQGTDPLRGDQRLSLPSQKKGSGTNVTMPKKPSSLRGLESAHGRSVLVAFLTPTCIYCRNFRELFKSQIEALQKEKLMEIYAADVAHEAGVDRFPSFYLSTEEGFWHLPRLREEFHKEPGNLVLWMRSMQHITGPKA